MTVIHKLASSLRRRDEVPNEHLAKEIVASDDRGAIDELVLNLQNKNKDVRHDCIKVLYVAGGLKPNLIAGHTQTFVNLLDQKDNRLQWGAMTALSHTVAEHPAIIYKVLPKIIAAAEKGSVITKDQAMNILVRLSAIPKYAEEAFALLLEQLQHSLPNQLPMYAENALLVVNDKNKAMFLQVLRSRLPDVDKESKRKRIEKVLRKLGQ